MLDLIIKNGKCYIEGQLKDVDVAVKEGKIHQIGQISEQAGETVDACLLYTSPSPRDRSLSRMPSSA